jgi:hypothetical protein
MGVEEVELPLQALGCGNVVGVHASEKRPACDTCGDRECRDDPPGPRPDDPDPRVTLFPYGRHGLSGAIIDYENLEVSDGLREQRLQRFVDRIRGIAAGKEDARAR